MSVNPDANDAPANSTEPTDEDANPGGIRGFLIGLVAHKASSAEIGAPTASTTIGTC